MKAFHNIRSSDFPSGENSHILALSNPFDGYAKKRHIVKLSVAGYHNSRHQTTRRNSMRQYLIDPVGWFVFAIVRCSCLFKIGAGLPFGKALSNKNAEGVEGGFLADINPII